MLLNLLLNLIGVHMADFRDSYSLSESGLGSHHHLFLILPNAAFLKTRTLFSVRIDLIHV